MSDVRFPVIKPELSEWSEGAEIDLNTMEPTVYRRERVFVRADVMSEDREFYQVCLTLPRDILANMTISELVDKYTRPMMEAVAECRERAEKHCFDRKHSHG